MFLDSELVERIKETFQEEPSSRLREIARDLEDDTWSEEAREAARQLLIERSIGKSPTPPEPLLPDPADEIAHAALSEEETSAAPGFLKLLKQVQVLVLILGLLILPVWAYLALRLNQRERAVENILNKVENHDAARDFEKARALLLQAVAEGRERDILVRHTDLAYRVTVVLWTATIILFLIASVLRKALRNTPGNELQT